MPIKAVVVGAGLTGGYSAYFLAKMGAQVTIIDPGDQLGCASYVNPGGINPLHGPGIPGPMSALAMSCYQRHLSQWEEIKQRSGINFHGRLVERLILAFTIEEQEALGKMESEYNQAQDFSADMLNAAQIGELPERFNPHILGGLLTRGNACVQGGLYVKALLGAAQSMGASLVRGEVDGVDSQGDEIVSVKVGCDAYRADEFVFCTGPKTSGIEKILEQSIPVTPLKGELLLVQLDEKQFQRDVTWGQYGLYHIHANQYWLGGTQQHDGLDSSVSESAADKILKGVQQFLPEITRDKVVDQRCGIRPMGPDALPLMEKFSRWNNAYLANGAGVKGVLYSAGLGWSVADTIIQGGEMLMSLQLIQARASLKSQND